MRFKTRDNQNWVRTMKIRKRKSDFFFFFLKTIMSFWTYSSRCHIKKIPLFDEKPFFDKFIFNLFDAHQKSSNT